MRCQRRANSLAEILSNLSSRAAHEPVPGAKAEKGVVAMSRGRLGRLRHTLLVDDRGFEGGEFPLAAATEVEETKYC